MATSTQGAGGGRGASRYDVFLSYSHQQDAETAPAVQRVLERLARPWNRARVLHVFRDESDLSASPGLWSSIQEALERSEWFLLLASPAAARSEWCQRELAHWLASGGDASRLLLAHTGGAIGWSGAGIDWDRTDALPRLLEDVLSEEPLSADLTKATPDPERADFRMEVGRLAAMVHGLTLRQLVDEDIAQQRRARRLRLAAVLTIVVLLVVATVAAVQARRANQQARINLAEAHASMAEEALARSDFDAVEEWADEALKSDDSNLRARGLRSYPTATGHSASHECHREAIEALAWTPDGRLLSGGRDRRLCAWDRPADELDRTEFESHIRSLVVLKEEGWIVAGTEQNALTWLPLDPDAGGRRSIELPVSTPVVALVRLGKDRLLAGAGRWLCPVKLDFSTGLALVPLPCASLDEEGGDVDALVAAPDGGSVFVATNGGGLRSWAVVDGGIQRAGPALEHWRGTPETIPALDVSSDGRYLAAGPVWGCDGPLLDGVPQVWDLGSGRRVPVFGGARGQLRALAFAPQADPE